MVLNIKELRVGNLVVYNEKVHQISDIFSSGTVNLSGVDGSIEIHEISGIEIIKFLQVQSNTNKEVDNDQVKYRIPISNSLSIHICLKNKALENIYMVVTQNPEKDARYNLPFTYIHELQNFYFVFNKEALNIESLDIYQIKR